MEIVINIPEEEYRFVKKQVADGITNPLKICIANGAPLPKGHGRLIDADVLVNGMEDDYELCEVVNATPTIIEADKAKSGE